MDRHWQLAAALLSSGLIVHCGGESVRTSPDTGGSTSVGGAGSGALGGWSTGASGGTGGADGGTGNLGPGCAGYGGIGGTPPHCADGTISAGLATDRGFCSTNEKCADATPLCARDVSADLGIACHACPGEGMVSVGNSCVDATEVTRNAYAAWLDSAPMTTGQSAECEWNVSFEPDASCMQKASVCQGECGAHPQVCVDWCDAGAYCAAQGKRLCGEYQKGSWGWPKVGADDWNNPNGGELLEACNDTGKDSYPYGNSFVLGNCNGVEAAVGTTVPVGSRPACKHQHADGGIYDVTGNVWEWEFACSAQTGNSDFCRLRGGSFLESGEEATCWMVEKDQTRDFVAEDLGFRCCGT